MSLGDAHALVIGVARYLHAPPLRETRDAADLAEVLRDPTCCAYPPAQVHVLVDEAATRAAILAALDELARATTAASTVLVYFAGHGARTAEADGMHYHLLPVDAYAKPREELIRTSIGSAELSARLRAIPAARLTTILDCCRAGELTDADLDAVPDMPPDAVAPLGRGRGRAVLAASRADGYSYAMPGSPHSAFTGHLLRGLRGAASGVGGVVRVCDLFAYVQQRLAEDNAAQRPVFKAELEENYPIALRRGGAVEPLALPPPPDKLPYDVFLSYRHDAPDDRAWVLDLMLPNLEALGIRACVEHRDFRLGANRIDEVERAIAQSRYTAAVLTPAYRAGGFDELAWLLAAYSAAESQLPRLIPLLRRPCEMPAHARMTAALDVSRDGEVPAALARLAVALRRPPAPRLDR